jgi:hypothetical protein
MSRQAEYAVAGEMWWPLKGPEFKGSACSNWRGVVGPEKGRISDAVCIR